MTFKILGGVIFVVVAILVVYYFCEGKGDLKQARKEFLIFGLKDGFVPQGICFSKWLDCFLISGYMKDKKLASRIYVVSKQSGSLVKYITLSENGKSLLGHFGGITCFGDNIWIATDGNVLRISQLSVKNAKSEEKVEIIDKFCPNNNADYCFVYDGLFWVGEFYKLGKFKTDISHHIKVDDKNFFHAMCFGYRILNNGKYGLSRSVPEKALSVPDLCQGICVCRDHIFVSTSYSIQKSNLMVFENVLKNETDKFIYLKNKKIPLYFLPKESIKRKLTLPAMSEGIDISDDRLYILFENASKKYRFFTRKKIKNVFSFFVNKL